ncbi:MAG: homoserine dehydrogenase, partial [Polyangiaceae bacterium]
MSAGQELTERRTPRGGAPVRIGLLGCGTVGGGVLRLLADNARYLGERVGVPLSVERVLVRDMVKDRVPECRRQWLTTSPDDVLGDPRIDLVVVVMGGETVARGLVEQ